MSGGSNAYNGPDEDEILESTKQNVHSLGFQMKRHLDHDKLQEGLKVCTSIVVLLQNTALSPKKYYDLYIHVTEYLRYLEHYLNKCPFILKNEIEVYELVQEEVSLLPRMYLMITVGAVYLKLKRCAVGAMLTDMVEMCRGIQHPTKGLFLRNYLMEMMKETLPDSRVDETTDGHINDSIEFILKNLNEMNRLWIRLQDKHTAKDKETKLKEHMEFKVLVGTNLVRLSQLEGLNLQKYAEDVLPRIMEHIVNSKDKISQQYLMECVIQVFPDDFHLGTLDLFLSACLQLHDDVDYRAIVMLLIERLTEFAHSSVDGIPSDIKVFDIFLYHVMDITQSRFQGNIGEMVGLFLALLTLAHKVYPNESQYVNQIYELCSEKLKASKVETIMDPVCIKRLVDMLKMTLNHYSDVSVVLAIPEYASMIDYLYYPIRKKVAIFTLMAALDEKSSDITDPSTVDKFLGYISCLLRQQNDGPEESEEADTESFIEEQNGVAKMIHRFNNYDTDLQYEILGITRDNLSRGGIARKIATFPSLFFKSLMLVNAISQRELNGERATYSSRKALQLSLSISQILKDTKPILCLKFFLEAALVADQCRYEAISSEFLAQACTLYEERIVDSKDQLFCVNAMVGTLQKIRNYEFEPFQGFITKMALYANNLVKKQDQCRAIYLCSHLFWILEVTPPEFRNGKRVLECLRKSLKIAEACVDATQQIQLYIEILNEYLYYFENENQFVTANYMSVILSMIASKSSSLEASPEDTAPIFDYYRNTQTYIALRKTHAPSSARYLEIETPDTPPTQ